MSAIELTAAAPADLEIRGLAKRFGGKVEVLADVSLAVGKSEAVALIGANGAGKSTLLRSCLRLVEPDAGEIRLFGENVKFKGMTWVSTVRDEDYNYVRKMYATIGQKQFSEFVGD